LTKEFLIAGNREIWRKLEPLYPSFNSFERWVIPKLVEKGIVKKHKINHREVNCTTEIRLDEYIMGEKR